MSRIDELIAEVCPNGVEFKAIGDIASYTRGVTYSKNDERPDGAIHVLRSNNITLSSNTLNFDDVKTVSDSVRVRDNQWLRASDILISAASGSKAHVGKVAYIYEDIKYCFGGFMAVLRTSSRIDSRFLFHLLIGSTFSDYLESALSTTTINNLNASIMNAFRVPVPPLEVQREIVKVLDTFTKLEAELEARRRQYKYYRDMLLTFGERTDAEASKQIIRWMMLNEIGQFIRGRRFTKADYVGDGISVIHYGEIYTQYGVWTDRVISQVRSDMADTLRYAKPGDVVITDVGETVEDVGKAVAWLGDEEVAIHDHCYAFRHSMNPKFVSYCMQTNSFIAEKAKYVARTKVNTLLIEGFSKIRIPVPPLEEQERIVAILDKFDALVNDLSSGLPAEIKARRQQYEHYRNRLLTFREAA
ncbi:restriction endonuclease subunit S [Nitrosomonas europaea]|uniref:restriction endonuclease subunit S n=1 Tax=Nitrosomonas europaea TaxID=915 RepID=UPI003267D873